MFPPRAPGVGLFLLRVSVAATLLIIELDRTSESPVNLLLAGALLISILLFIGFLTPYLSFIVCAYAFVSLFVVGFRPGALPLVSLILTSAALALLGPGAYSVDARLFGRRVLVVPSRRDSDRL